MTSTCRISSPSAGNVLMFTGIIEGVGRLASIDTRGGDARLAIDVGSLPFDDVRLGESIAVNGVCLTVVAFDATCFEADASNETLSLTTLGAARRRRGGEPGARDAPDRPPRRPSGQRPCRRRGQGARHRATMRARSAGASPRPPRLLRYIAKKGSICVDGVSLTVNEVDEQGFEVALIPHTVANTAFAATAVGDAVNLEIDLVARYVERLLATTQEHTHEFRHRSPNSSKKSATAAWS